MMIAIQAITFPIMIRFRSQRSGVWSTCCSSTWLCRCSAIIGASPETFGEVDGSRITAVSVFSRSLATMGQLMRMKDHLHRQVMADRLVIGE